MTQQICCSRQAERGFTLVELAIVMIIIGLLIGGILKGQELIANARVTSTVNQVKGVDAAITTFRDQYAALPGDMGPAGGTTGPTVRLPSCTAGLCATAGDGDGRIEGSNVNDPTVAPANSEGGRAWVHLAAAGVLGGVNAGIAAYGPGAVPDTAIGNGKLNMGYSNGTASALTLAGAATGTYLTTNTNETTAIGGANGVMIPKAAANIDRKLDDGNPNTGSVRSAGTNCATGTAITNGYTETGTGAVCNLAIRIQQ